MDFRALTANNILTTEKLLVLRYEWFLKHASGEAEGTKR